jgi:magnesium-transporting ATPase (P-type)
MIPANCNLIRDGKLISIPAINLVPGDVIYVRLGEKYDIMYLTIQ